MDQVNIEKILVKAEKEMWSYPEIFQAFKANGVERYETNVLLHEIKYVGGGESFIKKATGDFQALTAATEFNLEKLKLAIDQVQKREIDYGHFLAEIAAAGVSFYRVDMGPRTVTYHGPDRHKYVENIPKVKSKG
ncbi:MAG: DUF1398 family protein [Elusimicrobiota bacterium]